VCGHWNLAASAHPPEEGPLNLYTLSGFIVIQRGRNVCGPVIVRSRLNRQCALPYCGNHGIRFHERRHAVAEPHAEYSCGCQHHPREILCFHFS
jgi:hypothetical protein